MSKLETTINALHAKLDPIKGTQQWIHFNNHISKKLDEVDKDTQKKKVKKFHRDMGDFKSDSIYLWQSKFSPVIATNVNSNSPGDSHNGVRQANLDILRTPLNPIRCSTPIPKMIEAEGGEDGVGKEVIGLEEVLIIWELCLITTISIPCP